MTLFVTLGLCQETWITVGHLIELVSKEQNWASFDQPDPCVGQPSIYSVASSAVYVY